VLAWVFFLESIYYSSFSLVVKTQDVNVKTVAVERIVEKTANVKDVVVEKFAEKTVDVKNVAVVHKRN